GKDEKTIAACTKFIRHQIGDLIYGAPFAYRAYHKPRGYAGDYEMMNHLYRDELVGNSLFNQSMHKYFIDEPAGRAVKNRGYYLLEKIKETIIKSKKNRIRILAVASGPAMEQQLFLKEFAQLKNTFGDKYVEFVCVDQDEESLKHAQHQLLALNRIVRSQCSFKFINLAIKNIINQGLPESNFDLIYTAGLFDYFTDPVAQLTAKKLFGGLADGGKVIIGNYSTENPTRPLMEMILEWQLIYRSNENLKNLFVGIGKNVIVEKEELGINLFAVIQK
ncbi:MAG: class I SAM-dependent methyltransferase, partial [Pseudobdellovibrionaceae bacterium]